MEKRCRQTVTMAFATRVKEARRALGMSQDELARKLGYESKSSISMIERGKQDLPLTKIYEIAGALNVSVSFLVAGEVEDVPLSYHAKLEELEARIRKLELMEVSL